MKRPLRFVLIPITLLAASAVAQNTHPAPAPARAASFQGLGDFPGGTFESQGLRVSADGSVVVGNGTTDSGKQAFRWTQREGMVSLGNLPDGGFKQSWAVGVSADGSVIVGYGDPDGSGKWETHRDFRWTQGDGMVLRGGLDGAAHSEALAVSADGSVIVGDGGAQAFRWTRRDGVVELGVLPGRSNSRAIAVSADGSVVTGSSYQLPAWDHEEAFVWTPAGGMQGLGIPPGSSASFPNAISADGSVIVGSLTGAGVFRWSRSTGMTTLGQFPGARVTHPSAITADGAIIVGTSSVDRRAPSIAFIWDATHGMRSLQTVLETEHGLNLAGWHLQNASGLTPDGAVIVGWGTNPAGQTEAFRAVLKSQPAVAGESAAVSFAETGQQLNRLAGRGVALGDFNGDGKLDAFVANANMPDGAGYRVYLGDGGGHLTDSGQQLSEPANWEGTPAIGDVNGDRKLDVVTGKTVWLNDGQGRFTAHPELIETSGADLSGAVKLADLDGDGDLDLVAVSGWKRLGVYLNDGHGRFRDTGQRLGSAGIVAALAIGDVNRDGDIDLISAGWRNTETDAPPSRVWLNDGTGRFTDAGPVDHGENHAHGVALGDVNGDGSPDLVIACTTPDKAGKIYLNDGQGHFRDSGQTLAHRWAHSVALGDFDGDGSLDAFFACGEPATGTPNEVWLNDGKGSFRDSGVRLGSAFSWDVALGDLNGDRKLDALVANLRIADGAKNPPVFGGVPLEVWLNTSSQITSAYLGQPLPGATPEIFARDLVSLADTNEHLAPSFSPDGNEVLWFANRWPDPGPSLSMMARRETGRWSAPLATPFDGMMPAFSPDGRQIYFYAFTPGPHMTQEGQSHLDIWVAEKHGDGWSEPKCLNLVEKYPELRGAYHPRLARNGTLYFMGYAPGPRNSGIYRAELINGEHAKPELLPRSINLPPFLNWAPFIAPDESYLLFSSNRTGALDKYGDIYISRRQADGSWTEPLSLGAPVNTSQQEVFPGMSPDGKYLFFCRYTPGRKNDVYWVDAATIPALRPTTNHSQENSK